MAFHRFTVPNYTGGLPGGYDYINNAVVGTPAPVGGPRGDGGPNNGTYFLGFGEDGRTEFINRGLAALAENTDALDDLLRKDLAIPSVHEFVSNGSNSIVLTGPGIFLGNGGHPNTAAGINQLFRLTDALDVDPYSGLTVISVSAVGGDAIASGYSTGNITLTFSAALQNGQTYRVYFLRRSNLAGLLGGEFLEPRINAARTLQSRILTLYADLASQIIPGTSLIGGNQIIDPWGGFTSIVNLSPGTLRQQLQELLLAQNRNTRQRHVITDDYITFNDSTIFLNTTTLGMPFTLQLEDPGIMFRQRIHLFSTDPDILTNNVTLQPFNTESISGVAAPYVLDVPYGHWTLVTDGLDWYIY